MTTGDALDEIQRRFLEEVSKPETLQRLLGLILPHVKPGVRNAAYILAQTDRFGHLTMEPFFLRSIFANRYDHFIVITQPREAPRVNRALYDLVAEHVTVVENSDEVLRMMGILDNGIGQVGPLDLLLISPVTMARNFWKFLAAGGKPDFLRVTDTLNVRGAEFLKRVGAVEGDRFVVLHARDMSYMPEAAMQASNRLRCANIANYRLAVDWLVDQGYRVFRIGDSQSPRLDHSSDRVIDVPFLPDYDDFMDVFLLSRCDFAIVCSSGPETLIRAFGRPSLNANFPFQAWFAHLPSDLYIFKHYRDVASGRELPYQEILDRGLPHVENFSEYETMGLDVEENTPEELLRATQDMAARVERGAPPDNPDQKRFHAIGAAYGEKVEADPNLQARMVDCYSYARGWGTVAPSYLELNPDFLGDA